jgi:hypothetical protein
VEYHDKGKFLEAAREYRRAIELAQAGERRPAK